MHNNNKYGCENTGFVIHKSVIVLENMKTKLLILGILLSFDISIAFAMSPIKPTTNKVEYVAKQQPSNQAYNADVYSTNKVVKQKLAKSANDPVIKHLWNLQNADINRVVAEISRETGKNFIVSPQVQGKVTIISSHPMGPKESYQVFLSTLRVLGYAVVPDGKNLKIVPSRDAANQAQLTDSMHPGVGDQVVVRAIPIYYVSAMQLVPALRPLVPTWGQLNAYSPSNSIIASGTAENIQRIASIIKQVDTPAANGIDVMHLQHAIADDVVKEVNKLILAARANGANTDATLSADEQSNTVLISGNETSRLRLKVLIAKLDDESLNDSNNTQVVYLKYIQVKDMLPILKAMVHQNVSYSMSSGAANYSSSGNDSSSTGSTLQQASAQFTAAANSQINNATLNGGSGAANDKSKITIVGDVTNNALVITAPTTMMMKLKRVVNKLDVEPQQVLVQGIIAEVDAETAKQIGIQWGTGGRDAKSLGITGAAASAYAFNGNGFGIGFLKKGDMRALVQLLSTDTNANLVSTPSITVLNNSPADIEVGQTYSEISAEYTGPSGTGNNYLPPNTYSDKQIGLTLRVIPQVTGSHSVRLIINQTNSAIISGATTGGSPNPNTSTESLNTQVMVNNGQVLVLAGLINSQDTKVESKVPILGDIPLIGRLFRSSGTTTKKKDLMIFLRPIIINGKERMAQLTKQKYEFMRDVAILNAGNKGHLIASSILASNKPVQLPTPFHQH